MQFSYLPRFQKVSGDVLEGWLFLAYCFLQLKNRVSGANSDCEVMAGVIALDPT